METINLIFSEAGTNMLLLVSLETDSLTRSNLNPMMKIAQAGKKSIENFLLASSTNTPKRSRAETFAGHSPSNGFFRANDALDKLAVVV